MPEAHVGIVKIVDTVSSLQCQVNFIKQLYPVIIIMNKPFMVFQLFYHQFHYVLYKMTLQMYPVNCPWIVFISSIAMGCFSRNDHNTSWLDRLSCFPNFRPSFSFYTIDDNVLVNAMQAFPEMKFCLGVIPYVRNMYS